MARAGTEWLDLIKEAEKTAFVQDGKLKVHYKFPNGHEMAEEYNLSSNALIRRAWRRRSELRKAGDWEVEVGDPELRYNSVDSIGIKESNDNPYVIKRVTKTNIEWRIRNLPYPPETYSVTVDESKRCVIVRTSNKKYYKVLDMPDLDRAGVNPQQDMLEFSHKFNTLIITYKKPQSLLQMESNVIKELMKLEKLNDGKFDCNPS